MADNNVKNHFCHTYNHKAQKRRTSEPKGQFLLWIHYKLISGYEIKSKGTPGIWPVYFLHQSRPFFLKSLHQNHEGGKNAWRVFIKLSKISALESFNVLWLKFPFLLAAGGKWLINQGVREKWRITFARAISFEMLSTAAPKIKKCSQR